MLDVLCVRKEKAFILSYKTRKSSLKNEVLAGFFYTHFEGFCAPVINDFQFIILLLKQT